jgi:hypothetical protein
MITNRLDSRSDEAAPVLFRLPNLRPRDVSPAVHAAESKTAIDVAGPSLRIDTPTPSFPAPVLGDSQRGSTSLTSGDLPPAESRQSTSPSPQGRSWMERIGSRLILLVTLMVIVSAAWLTGQRIPASKPDVWQSPTLSQLNTSEPSINGNRSSANASGNSNSIATGSSTTLLSPTSDAASSVEPTATLPNTTSLPQGNVAMLAAPLNKSLSAQPLQTSVYKPTMDTGSLLPAEDVASVFNAVTLEPTNLDGSSSNTDQEITPISQALPVTSPSDHTGVLGQPSGASNTVSTKTPNAPVLDPSVLLPWIQEQMASRENRISVTPNPIVDWSLYLPGAEQTVRAASATQIPGNGTETRQAGSTSGVTINPYSR